MNIHIPTHSILSLTIYHVCFFTSIHVSILLSIHWFIFFSPTISCRQQCTSFLNTSSYIFLTGVQYLFMQNLYFTQERLNLYIYFAKRKGCDSRGINTIHSWFLLGYLWKWEAVWEFLDPQKLLPYGATIPYHKTAFEAMSSIDLAKLMLLNKG